MIQSRRRLRGTTAVIAGLGILAGAALSGCSTVGADEGTSPDSSRELDVSLLEDGYAGEFEAPPTEGPAAQTGKDVWYISCGEAFAACAAGSTAFAEAGGELGWNVTIVDGKADPSTAATAIRQGVAAGVDGIGLWTFDCPGIKSSLLEARDAGVPVVNFGSLDCDDEAFGSEEKLFAATINIQGSDNAADYWYGLGVARATYVAAALGGEPGQIINIHETSQRGHQYNDLGFVDTLADLCAECELVDTAFTFSQVPTKSTEIFKGALLQNPNADVYAWGVDAMMGLGLQTAIAQNGNGTAALVGAEGLPPNIDLIRSGEQDAVAFIPYDWYMWGLADTLNRILAGEGDDLPSQGGGFMFVDAENNLPEEGVLIEPTVDYKAAYRAVWNQ